MYNIVYIIYKTTYNIIYKLYIIDIWYIIYKTLYMIFINKHINIYYI